MNEQEAYESWFRGEQGKPYDGAYTFAEAAWHAALAWLRSQGEPVAHLAPEGYDDDPVPVFLAPQPAIPDGWRLVPAEPTEEMLIAAIEADVNDTYRAMLAASPQCNQGD